MKKRKLKYRVLLTAAVAAAVLAGCSAPGTAALPEDPLQTSQAISGPENLPEAHLLEADLLGEWLYEAHGCILEFREDGICSVLWEGTEYTCSYRCETDQVLLSCGDRQFRGEIRENGMLYFEGSATGFLTARQWELDGIRNEAEFSGTSEAPAEAG